MCVYECGSVCVLMCISKCMCVCVFVCACVCVCVCVHFSCACVCRSELCVSAGLLQLLYCERHTLKDLIEDHCCDSLPF